MDKQDFVLLGVFIVVVGFASLDFGLGASFLEPQVEGDLSGDTDVKDIVSTGSEAFVVAESRSTFSDEGLERKGECGSFVTMEKSLFEKTSADRYEFSEANPFSKLVLYRFSESTAERFKTFNKSTGTEIVDIAGTDSNIYLAVKKISTGCDDEFSEPELVVLDKKGELSHSFSPENLSGGIEALKAGDNGSFYILASGSLGKYGETGENLWMEEVGSGSDFRAKKLDVTSDGVYVGLDDTNGHHRLKFLKIGSGGETVWSIEEDVYGVKDNLISLKATDNGDIVFAASVGNNDSMYLRDLIVKKIKGRTGEEIWRNEVDAEKPSIERKGKIFLREEKGPQVYFRIKEFLFERSSGGFESKTNLRTGLRDLDENGKTVKTLKTRDKYTGPDQVFRMHGNIYQVENSKISLLEKKNQPFKPEIGLDLPRWVPYLTPKPSRYNEN